VTYPTGRAVWLAGFGAPFALALALVRPQLWPFGVAWLVFVAGLMLVDWALAASGRRLTVTLTPPRWLPIGGEGEAGVRLDFAGRAPREAELAVGVGARLEALPERRRLVLTGPSVEGTQRLRPLRRGEGTIERLWLRWRGPLGLVWRQREQPLGLVAPIVPNIQSVKDEGIRLFARDAAFGLKSQLNAGDGSEFHALQEFRPGMDRRTIDWKQSARHGALMAKEYRTERNHHIILALDCGRLMSEPLGGVPRIDRALNAGLLIAYVGLKLGDRIGLFAFDAKPRLFSGAVAGVGAFPLIQRLAAQVDYSALEANYTLGLTTLAAELERRSLIVVFTDFADATSAELMIDNARRLMRRHLLLFVVMRDEVLETMAAAEPQTPEDVSRAVTAEALLKARAVVVGRLRRLGAQIVEAPAARIGPALIDRYLELKRRELI
jgi:uncharacterized protein (DUF58 family)